MQQKIKDYSFGNTIAYTVESFQPIRGPKPIAFGSLLLKKDIFLEYQKELKNNQLTKFETTFNIIQNNKKERIQRLLKILEIKEKILNKGPRKLYKENVNFLESISYPEKAITNEDIEKKKKKIKSQLKELTFRKFTKKVKKLIQKSLFILLFSRKNQKNFIQPVKSVTEVYNQIKNRLKYALIIKKKALNPV